MFDVAHLQSQVIASVKGGASLASAIAAAGLPESTLDEWLADEAFVDELQQAEGTAHAVAEIRLLKTRPGVWLQGPGRTKTSRKALPASDPKDDDPTAPRRKCAKKTRSGKPCNRWAIKGGKVCPMHGGSAPQVKAAAARRLAIVKVQEYMTNQNDGLPLVDPLKGLLRQIQLSARMVEILTSLVNDLEVGEEGRTFHPLENRLVVANHQGDMRQHVFVQMYGEWSDRHARHCKMALDAGVAERQVQIAEEQGQLIVRLLAASIDDPDLGLSRGQKLRIRQTFLNGLRALPAS